MKDPRPSVAYINDTKTLLVGVPDESMKAVQDPGYVFHFPIREIMEMSSLTSRDVDLIAFTTCKNYDAITLYEKEKIELWHEFQEYVKNKRERVSTALVLPFKTGEKDDAD